MEGEKRGGKAGIVATYGAMRHLCPPATVDHAKPLLHLPVPSPSPSRDGRAGAPARPCGPCWSFLRARWCQRDPR